jgi:predicted kinase
MIVIVFGLPGSGKSFFASRLAKMINADYINSDMIRKEMFASSTYSEKEKAAVYNVMIEKTKVLGKPKEEPGTRRNIS